MVTISSPVNPFARLHLNKTSYYGPEHVLNMALDAIGDRHPASLEVVGLPGMGKTSLLRYLANPETLIKHKEKFSEPFRSNPSKLLPVLIEFQYWQGDIDPIQYIYNQLIDSIKRYRQLGKKDEGVSQSVENDPINKVTWQSMGGSSEIVAILIQQLRSLYAEDIRPVFLIDDIDSVLQRIKAEEKSQYPFKPEIVVHLRAWRSSAAFIICTENKLADIDSLASSNLFGLFDPVYLGGLNDKEAEKLLNEPIREIQGVRCFPEKDITLLLKQAGSHPYLLILGGKLLWEIRERYGLLDKADQLSIDIQNILIERLYENAERRFKAYWDKLSRNEQWLLIDLFNMKTPSSGNLLLHKMLNSGLIRLDSEGKPAFFSALFQRFVKSQVNLLSIDEISPAYTERKLFQYLEKNRGRPCAFDEIAQEVWLLPLDRNEKKMRRRIQVLVSRLNNRLQEKHVGLIVKNVRNSGYELIEESSSQDRA